MNLELLLEILFEKTVLLGTFFIICGIIKLFIYYKLFGILIFEFFDVKEVITLFANNLLAYFILIIFTASILLLSPNSTGFWVFWIPILFTVLSIIYYLVRPNIFLYETIFQNIFFWGLFILINQINKYLSLNLIEQDKLSLYFLGLILVTLGLFSIYNGINEYYKVRFKKYYLNTEIEINGNKFTSSKSKYYIGKTEKYLFIYDELTETSEVIPTSSVNKITFKKNSLNRRKHEFE